jgi:predicted acyltransferase
MPSLRLKSADVYRGFVMFLMMAEVLRFHAVSAALPQSGFWKFMAYNQNHVAWTGCSLHDLIQPSFSFLVGLVLPFSLFNRQHSGEGFGKMLRHAAWRALVLVVLGIFLRSQWSPQTYFTFEDTLSQIGLGYAFLFALGFQSQRVQIGAFLVLILGYWLAFALYPLPPSNFDYQAVFSEPELLRSGFQGHWNKNSNLAWAFDTWFLNLFPRESPFVANAGGYATLSFIPTLATMILGLLGGNTLIAEGKSTDKLKKLVYFGLLGLVLGLVFHYAGICPNVKRIWTPTWVLFSGGWCFLLMAGFYYLIDLKGKEQWFFWLKVIGMNSIAAYVMAHGFDAYVSKALHIHLGPDYDTLFGMPYRTLVHGGLILLAEWWVLWWMYRRGVFIRI